jgi:hypothetical protein
MCDVAISVFLSTSQTSQFRLSVTSLCCLSLARHILHLPPSLELGVLNGWICHMFTVSITALILRCTVPFQLTCVMRYGLLYGCSYLLALSFSSKTKSPTW